LHKAFDAFIFPTVANVAPRIADIKSDDDYFKLNGLALRNTYVANMLNGCAISLPMNQREKPPTGMSLLAPWGHDKSLFEVSQHISNLL
jgi:aspartyl-tRNA(Asn)/glutamyl-tRNA(Gln) amidotransferase subunit A